MKYVLKTKKMKKQNEKRKIENKKKPKKGIQKYKTEK
jgi:hypothetical protein